MNKDKNSQYPKLRCPVCDLQEIAPTPKITYSCPGCGKVFIRKDGKFVIMEAYLDPNNHFQFDLTENLSPEFHELAGKEKDVKSQDNIIRRQGIIVNHLESYQKWAERGTFCLKNQLFEESIYCFLRAVHDFDFNPMFWLNIALVSSNFNFFEIARRAVAIAEKIDPNHELLGKIVRRIETEHQNWTRDTISLSEEVKLGRRLYKIAEDNLRKGNLPRAEIRLRQSLDKDPSNHLALNNLGTVLMQLNQVDEGEKFIQKVLTMNPDNADAHYNLMNVYLVRNNLPKAIACAKEAVRLEPNNTRFRKKLREMEEGVRQEQGQMNPSDDGINRNMINNLIEMRYGYPNYLDPTIVEGIIQASIPTPPFIFNLLEQYSKFARDMMGKTHTPQGDAVEIFKGWIDESEPLLKYFFKKKDELWQTKNYARLAVLALDVNTRKGMYPWLLRFNLGIPLFQEIFPNLPSPPTMQNFVIHELSLKKPLDMTPTFTAEYEEITNLIEHKQFKEAQLRIVKLIRAEPLVPLNWIILTTIFIATRQFADAKNCLRYALACNQYDRTLWGMLESLTKIEDKIEPRIEDMVPPNDLSIPAENPSALFNPIVYSRMLSNELPLSVGFARLMFSEQMKTKLNKMSSPQAIYTEYADPLDAVIQGFYFLPPTDPLYHRLSKWWDEGHYARILSLLSAPGSYFNQAGQVFVWITSLDITTPFYQEYLNRYSENTALKLIYKELEKYPTYPKPGYINVIEPVLDLMKQGEYQNAILLSKKAISQDPLSYFDWMNVANCYAHLGDSVSEKKALRFALVCDHNMNPLWWNLQNRPDNVNNR